jgi:hypothetical protein
MSTKLPESGYLILKDGDMQSAILGRIRKANKLAELETVLNKYTYMPKEVLKCKKCGCQFQYTLYRVLSKYGCTVACPQCGYGEIPCHDPIVVAFSNRHDELYAAEND